MHERGAGVVVDGWTRTADEVAAQLRRVGLRVRAGGHAADAAELGAAGGDPLPQVVVLVGGPDPRWSREPSRTASWHVHGVPHLPVLAGAERVVVGPLVVPGRSACLGCVGDRLGWSDRAPAVDGGSGLPGEPDDAARVLAASVATVTVLSVLRGDVSLAGMSTEVGACAGTVLHRVWTSRPRCGCLSVRMVG